MITKKILLVDDDKDFVQAQSIMLKHLGYEIIIANSGKEGYEKIVAEKPQLIILDVNMEKEFSGFEVHKKVRENPDLIDIPIIMLTGIDTYHVSHQIIEMYRSMRGKDDFEMNRVLRISDYNTNVAVEYYDEKGEVVYLPLDAFVSKSNANTLLHEEIKKFIN